MYPIIVRKISLSFALFYIGSATAQNSCPASCFISATDTAPQVGWGTATYSSTATATIVEIVNTDLGTTRTTTIINDQQVLPTDTNAQGTRTTRVTYTKGSEVLTTDIAFPTIFNVIGQTYFWEGTLSTTDGSGQSACVTTDKATIKIDFFTQPASITFPPGAENDPRGWNFQPETKIRNWIKTYLEAAIPSEAAFASCSGEVVAPQVPILAVSYAVSTSVSTEGGTSTIPSSSSSRSSTVPVSNTASRTTSPKSAGTITRTVVSDGGSGPTTLVQTIVEAAPTGSSNGGGKTLVGVELLTLTGLVGVVMAVL